MIPNDIPIILPFKDKDICMIAVPFTGIGVGTEIGAE